MMPENYGDYGREPDYYPDAPMTPVTRDPAAYAARWDEEFRRLAPQIEAFAFRAGELAREIACDVAAATAAAVFDLDLQPGAPAEDAPLVRAYAERCFDANWERMLTLWQMGQMHAWRAAYHEAVTRALAERAAADALPALDPA